ncbi:NnrU family protein [Aestuariivirga sp.]|uniref:NnrU family protein n=1 Tax=Aestuariivirga sp. TaxID=2650926 RepID=UPI00301870E4
MLLLAFGVLLTAALHLVAAVPSLKARIRARVGERAYGPLFGVASIIGIAIIVLGWRSSDFVSVYEPPAWGRHANYLLTLIAFVFMGIFLFRGSWRQKVRFPMAFAAIFWAVGHLLANGDLASIILFGGFLVYAILHIIIGTLNGVRPSPVVREGHDLLSVLGGIALYGVMTQLHMALIGVPVFQLN